MLGNVFSFWIGVISTCVNFIFTLKINENPDITFGTFLLSCAFIGLAIYFVLGTDFIPLGGFNKGSSSSSSGNSNDGYQPKHAPGNTRTYSSNYSTRAGRNK